MIILTEYCVVIRPARSDDLLSDYEVNEVCDALEELDIAARIQSLVRTLIDTRTATDELIVEVKEE